MSYWMKRFIDGTSEKGTDADLANRKASWHGGRLEGIASAILSYAGTVIKVYGDNIWQKDQFTAGVAGGNLPPSRIARSLGLQVTEDDVGKCAYLLDEGHHVYVLDIEDHVDGNHIELTEEDVGRWLVVKVSRVGTVGLLIEDKYRV